MLPQKSIDYRNQALSTWRFKVGMLMKLPSVFWWGISIRSLNEESCEVTIPYSWRTQNPFKSIYFAALNGAGELSTGALCQMYIAGLGSYSMLVTQFRSEFYKKATTKVTFSCSQGRKVHEVLSSLQSGSFSTLELESVGKNTNGEVVARIFVTWSFKKRD
ncbi:MAG: DUF4442 domain-containing protein [Saprospiraceae bacterium]|nr:MAG: thioesterase [Bacteroidetes bacterium OLB9]MCO6463647.1 DUF4442 domain-containing protein [Saprospiraceae bacterium]MCZ2338867.1 DUF4442 domain-containing protein [Chitinophagales bacterium]